MTEAVIGFNPSFTTGWDPFIDKNPATVVKSDSITESHSFIKPSVGIARQVLIPSSSGFVPSTVPVNFPLNRDFVAKVLSKESATATLQVAAPTAVQEFFQRAESRLSTGREITAQRALNYLQRIRALIVDIGLDSLPGRVLSLADSEDGSSRIEWICNRSRLGFVFDNDNESSWFIVLPKGLSRSGYLSSLKSLRGLLEEFIAAGE